MALEWVWPAQPHQRTHRDKRMLNRLLLILALVTVTLHALAEPPATYRDAKKQLREHVYHDRNDEAFGTLYCGCQWRWRGESGGRVIYDDNCPAKIDHYGNRADRTEHEHIVPISRAAGHRACWQDGGRSHCAANDDQFALMYADMHNLTPAIGAINAQRSNHRYGDVDGHEADYGACTTAFDEHAKRLEPRDQAKGFIARTYFYMADRYALADEILPPATEKLMMRWDRQYPVSDWERLRNQRIAKVMGHTNPYVTGERDWRRGQSGSGQGFEGVSAGYEAANQSSYDDTEKPIIGNTNSDIYHLPDCPSYSLVGESSREYFETEAGAKKAGYRKAGNC